MRNLNTDKLLWYHNRNTRSWSPCQLCSSLHSNVHTPHRGFCSHWWSSMINCLQSCRGAGCWGDTGCPGSLGRSVSHTGASRAASPQLLCWPPQRVPSLYCPAALSDMLWGHYSEKVKNQCYILVLYTVSYYSNCSWIVVTYYPFN